MNKTVLFLFSATGLLVVNNLFLYWQFFEFDLNLFLSNTIGIALFLEAFLLQCVFFTGHFQREPVLETEFFRKIHWKVTGDFSFSLQWKRLSFYDKLPVLGIILYLYQKTLIFYIISMYYFLMIMQRYFMLQSIIQIFLELIQLESLLHEGCQVHQVIQIITRFYFYYLSFTF